MAVYVPDPDITAQDLIDDLGRVLAEAYMGAEDELLQEVARRAYRDLELRAAIERTDPAAAGGLRYAIRRNRELAELAAHRAQSIRELQLLAIQTVARLKEQNLAQDLINAAAAQGEAEMAARLNMARRLPATTTLTGSASQAVTQLTLSLQSRLEALNQRITRYPQDAYQRIIATTTPSVLLGAQTQLLAQRQAVQAFLSEGITGFVDRADRRWRIGTYAEMAGRTSVARAYNDAGIWRMKQSGLNLVTVQGGLASCPKCAPWVGKILSTDGTTGTVVLPHATRDEEITVTIFGTVDQARNAGLGHPNCSHKFTAYLPGLSIPQAGFEYSPEADKARERQRDIEVQIRAAKRDMATAGDAVTRQRASRKVKELQAEMREHLAATGRKRNPAREQLHFADGKGRPRPNPTTPRPGNPRPVAGTPRDSSLNVQIRSTTRLGSQVQTATSSIAKVHTIPNGLKPVAVTRAPASSGWMGAYRPLVSDIRIKANGPTVELTTAHEIGHYLDWNLLGDRTTSAETTNPTRQSTRDWFAAVQETQAVQSLRARLAVTKSMRERDHIEYLLSPDELWGRSYAQWVALRSGNEAMLDSVEYWLASSELSTSARQWGKPDFERVASTIDAIFREKGLLK